MVETEEMPGIAAAAVPSYRRAPAKAICSVKLTKRDEDPSEDDPENICPNTILRISAGCQKSCLREEQVKVRAQPMCFELLHRCTERGRRQHALSTSKIGFQSHCEDAVLEECLFVCQGPLSLSDKQQPHRRKSSRPAGPPPPDDDKLKVC